MSSSEEYAIVVVQLSDEDGGGYYGFVPDLPGCASDGETRTEALSNTEDALSEWLHEQGARGVDIPEPGRAQQVAEKRAAGFADALEAFEEYLQAFEAYREEQEQYRASTDAKILDSERRFAELVAMLKDDKGQLPNKLQGLLSKHEQFKKRAH